jgi:hypothetical protein
MGPGGATAPDTTVTRTAAQQVSVGNALNAVGLTGAIAGARWVGSHATGPPTTGTFSTGDWLTTLTGQMWICTAGGSPGTWTQVGTLLQTSTTGDGRITALLPTNVSGDWPAWSGFLNQTDTQPVWTMRAGFLSAAGVQLGVGGTTAPDTTFTRAGAQQISIGSCVNVAGLTGAQATARWVGTTTGGAPASGTFATGDFITTTTGQVWICTAGGTSGTWYRANQAVLSPTVSAGAVTVTPNTCDIANITGLSATTAITISTTGAVDGQLVTVRVTDNGTGRTISWVNTENSTVTAPTTTTASTMKTVQFQWNSVTSKWRCNLVA